MLPWINYELWSQIEKEKESKQRYKEERKADYVDMLQRQGIDVSKIKLDDIVFDDENEESPEDGSIEVIE